MHDLIIVGAGPAGLVAGLYAARYRLNPLILEKTIPGGQILLSSEIENFPGFPGGIATRDLIERFKKQVEDLNVRIAIEEVKEITSSFKLKTPLYNIKTEENFYETKSVIIASGATARRLGVNGEARLVGKGVSYCGACDAPLFRDKEVVVVGAGDRAIEEAIYLTRYAKKVTLIHRRQELRASEILVEKARQEAKINFVLDTVIEEIEGKERVEAVKIKNVKTNSVSELLCQGVFIFVGISPDTAFVKNLLQLDEAGFIITSQDLEASAAGIFAAGDCRKKALYQVINACGEGAVAAHAAHLYLLNN